MGGRGGKERRREGKTGGGKERRDRSSTSSQHLAMVYLLQTSVLHCPGACVERERKRRQQASKRAERKNLKGVTTNGSRVHAQKRKQRRRAEGRDGDRAGKREREGGRMDLLRTEDGNDADGLIDRHHNPLQRRLLHSAPVPAPSKGGRDGGERGTEERGEGGRERASEQGWAVRSVSSAMTMSRGQSLPPPLSAMACLRRFELNRQIKFWGHAHA